MATILVMNGPCEGRWYPVVEGRTLVVGRGSQLLAQVEDVKVSRKHLEIRFMEYERRFVVVDLDSRNGVFLNGHRITHHRPLAEDDRIRLGYTMLLFTGRGFENTDQAHHFLRQAQVRHQAELNRLAQEQAHSGKSRRSKAKRFSLARLLRWR